MSSLKRLDIVKESKSYEEENFGSCIRTSIMFWNDWLCIVEQNGDRYKERCEWWYAENNY